MLGVDDGVADSLETQQSEWLPSPLPFPHLASACFIAADLLVYSGLSPGMQSEAGSTQSSFHGTPGRLSSALSLLSLVPNETK